MQPESSRQGAQKLPALFSPGGKAVMVVVAFGLVIGLLAQVDMTPDLSYLDAVFLAGPHSGRYHATGRELQAIVQAQNGRLEVVETAGSGDNVERMVAPTEACKPSFALVQDGMPWQGRGELALLGRLPNSEALFVLGRGAGTLRRLSQLRGMRIGIGPRGSGTAAVADRLFSEKSLASLELTLSHHGIDEQLELARKGELDLAVFVMARDAAFIKGALTGGELRVARLEHMAALASRLPFARLGQLPAGYYDPVGVIPPFDVAVLLIDTLVTENACVDRSAAVAMLRALTERFPDFIRHNQSTPNLTGMPLAEEARMFFSEGGAQWVDLHIPWAVDIMAPSNWVHIAMAVSILFNLMGIGHRFQLWRVDVGRVKLERELAGLLGIPSSSLELTLIEPDGSHRSSELQQGITKVTEGLQLLGERCRRRSGSVLVPMGQEMAYRYQETLIRDLLTDISNFRQRLIESDKSA